MRIDTDIILQIKHGTDQSDTQTGFRLILISTGVLTVRLVKYESPSECREPGDSIIRS
ncbi:hypothetical protein LJC12_01715 [Odoribacter sp. OttesenSCG-928-J03]|nr:hypothetical protein [Odoribacter sp. OttesenSCG-928-J03]